MAEVYFSQGESSEPLDLSNVHEVRPSAWALIEDGWKLVRVSDGTMWLYHLNTDPTETTNWQTATSTLSPR